MARLGDPERGLDGFLVAHFADQDDVGILPEDGAEGVAVGQGVGEEFALVDEGFLRREKVFDRVLDRDDVDGPFGVDVVDHAGQGRRLAAPGGAGDEDQAPGQIAQLGDARAGMPSRWKLHIDGRKRRMAAATPPFCMKTLARNRPRSLNPNEKSSSSFSSNIFFCLSVRML